MRLNYSIIVNEELLLPFSILVALRNLAPTTEKKVFNVDLSTQQHLIMIAVCLLKNRSIKSRNYNVHKLFSISCRNAETLGCKFSPVRKKSCLWRASLFCTTQFTLTWFHFGQELSPLARLSLPWQNPQRLDFPFIWLWFTGPFWPSSQFAFLYNKHIDPQVKYRFYWLKKGSSNGMAGSKTKHVRGDFKQPIK